MKYVQFCISLSEIFTRFLGTPAALGPCVFCIVSPSLAAPLNLWRLHTGMQCGSGRMLSRRLNGVCGFPIWRVNNAAECMFGFNKKAQWLAQRDHKEAIMYQVNIWQMKNLTQSQTWSRYGWILALSHCCWYLQRCSGCMMQLLVMWHVIFHLTSQAKGTLTGFKLFSLDHLIWVLVVFGDNRRLCVMMNAWKWSASCWKTCFVVDFRSDKILKCGPLC